MAITKPMGLRFPKTDYKIKINGRTKFEATTEVFTLEATGLWDGLVGAQLSHLPARAVDAIGQTIADPTVTVAGNARIVRFKSPDSTEPVAGEVYIDIYSGTILFNTADAGLSVSVTYYIRADLVDHNAMNRIWQAGHTYIVGDEAWADFSDLQSAFTACVDGDSIKLMKDVTTTGTTLTKAIKIEGNNKKIIKSGTATNSRAINFSGDLIVRDVEFVGWSASGDICLYASADVKAIVSSNKAISNTKLTNASTVCTYSIVENNLPFSENVGQATTIVTNNVVDKIMYQYTASTSVSLNDLVWLDLTNPTKCKTTTTPGDDDVLLGFAQNNAAIGVTVNVALSGLVSGLSGLTPGRMYFASLTGTLVNEVPSLRPINSYYGLTSPYDFIVNPTGTLKTYHTQIGRAISSSVIHVNLKRIGNVVEIDASANGLYIGNTFVTTLGQSLGGSLNVFGNAGGVNLPFACKSPWELELDIDIDLIALRNTNSTLNAHARFGLSQESTYGTFVYNDIEYSIYWIGDITTAPVTKSTTIKVILKNLNPGSGRVRLTLGGNTGTGIGTKSGTTSYTIRKARINFL